MTSTYVPGLQSAVFIVVPCPCSTQFPALFLIHILFTSGLKKSGSATGSLFIQTGFVEKVCRVFPSLVKSASQNSCVDSLLVPNKFLNHAISPVSVCTCAEYPEDNGTLIAWFP